MKIQGDELVGLSWVLMGTYLAKKKKTWKLSLFGESPIAAITQKSLFWRTSCARDFFPFFFVPFLAIKNIYTSSSNIFLDLSHFHDENRK